MLLTRIYQAIMTGLLVVFGNKGGEKETPPRPSPKSCEADFREGGHPMRPDRETLADREAKDHAVDSFAFTLKGIHPIPWVDEDILKYLWSKGLK